jgi:cold shock CspA family protein
MAVRHPGQSGADRSGPCRRRNRAATGGGLPGFSPHRSWLAGIHPGGDSPDVFVHFSAITGTARCRTGRGRVRRQAGHAGPEATNVRVVYCRAVDPLTSGSCRAAWSCCWSCWTASRSGFLHRRPMPLAERVAGRWRGATSTRSSPPPGYSLRSSGLVDVRVVGPSVHRVQGGGTYPASTSTSSAMMTTMIDISTMVSSGPGLASRGRLRSPTTPGPPTPTTVELGQGPDGACWPPPMAGVRLSQTLSDQSGMVQMVSFAGRSMDIDGRLGQSCAVRWASSATCSRSLCEGAGGVRAAQPSSGLRVRCATLRVVVGRAAAHPGATGCRRPALGCGARATNPGPPAHSARRQAGLRG